MILRSIAIGLLTLSVSAAVQAEVRLDEAWVRAMPPTQRMTAGYGTLMNAGSGPVTVVGASSPIAASGELHTTEQVGERMRMVPLGPVTIAPGETFQFAPGGPHVMLMGVEAMPAAGSAVQLCFALASGSAVCEDAQVSRKAPDTGDGGHAHHH